MYIIINGKVAVDNNEHTRALAGRILRWGIQKQIYKGTQNILLSGDLDNDSDQDA